VWNESVCVKVYNRGWNQNGGCCCGSRRRFGEAIADQSGPLLGQIQQLLILEDLGEALFDCPDQQAWLARIDAAVRAQPDNPPNSGASL
jgi:hypothetical protein